MPTPVQRLSLVLSAGAAALFLLYVLGRLKLVYYYGTFGIELAGIEPSIADCLFESWFTIQNVGFFVLLWWIVLKTRSVWAIAIGVLYSLIPLGSHYAFALEGSSTAGLLIDYRHTLLKLLPFVLLLVLWLRGPSNREKLRDLSWPLPPAGRALFILIALAWAISSAKHFGSFDANRALRQPEEYLVRVHLGPAAGSELRESTGPAELYLLHADRERLLLWDRAGSPHGEIRTLSVPRSSVEWVEGRKHLRVQPGGRYL